MNSVSTSSLNGDLFHISGSGDVVSRTPSIVKPRDTRKRPSSRKRSNSSSSSGRGTGTVVADEFYMRNGVTSIYMEEEEHRVSDEGDEWNITAADGSEIYMNGPGVRSTNELEIRFPKELMAEEDIPVDVESSSERAEPAISDIQPSNPNPTDVPSAHPEQFSLELEDYVSLPESYNLLFGFIATGIAFVTGMLVMVLYTQLDAENEGPTVKVLCIIIIIPTVFFLTACGMNCYGRQLEKNYTESTL